MSAVIITILIFLWGVCTTMAGLYFSWYNNFKQNTDIIKELKLIRIHLAGSELVNWEKVGIEKPKETKEFKIAVPDFIYNMIKGSDKK